jgi:hypothetical protein
MKKYFTVKEANQLLPVLSKDLKALQEIQKDFEDKFEQLQQLKHEIPSHHARDANGETDPFFSLEAAIDFLQYQAEVHINNIQTLGVLLKDIERGLVDFPSWIQGKEVELCWHLGEDEVAHYHFPYEGYAGRKPIKD